MPFTLLLKIISQIKKVFETEPTKHKVPDECKFCKSKLLVGLGGGRTYNGFSLHNSKDYLDKVFAKVCVNCGLITIFEFNDEWERDYYPITSEIKSEQK